MFDGFGNMLIDKTVYLSDAFIEFRMRQIIRKFASTPSLFGAEFDVVESLHDMVPERIRLSQGPDRFAEHEIRNHVCS